MRSRPPRETIAPKLLPYLSESIDAYTLAERVGTTFTGCASTPGLQFEIDHSTLRGTP